VHLGAKGGRRRSGGKALVAAHANWTTVCTLSLRICRFTQR